MVERLRNAIEKARERRRAAAASEGEASASHTAAAASGAAAGTSRGMALSAPPPPLWELLPEARIDPKVFERNRLVTWQKTDPAHMQFDLLRTKLLRALADNGWRRIAITSPTKGCGKTLVAANLAFSLARQPDIRTALIDLDLRVPGLANMLGISDASPISWFLNGTSPIESFLSRFGDNLALGFNGERVRDSTEMIQSERCGQVLGDLIDRLDPDVVIYDLPPMLVGDDAVASLSRVDGVLLVAAVGHSTPDEIAECERLIPEDTRFLGVLLNKAVDAEATQYDYA